MSAALVLAMAALCLAAAALATRPWWRSAEVPRLRRRRANVAAYDTRLAEIAAEEAAGLLGAEEAQALRQELGARLLAEAASDADPPSAPARVPRRPRAALLLGFLLAVFAAGGYWLSGTWVLQAHISAERQAQAQIEAMVQRLAQRLERNPDDPQGWALLGRSYFVMQRYADAARAYHEANARAPQAEWLASEGEALAFAQGRDLRGEPLALFEKALALDADEGKALWYAGLAAEEAGDAATARARWEKLVAEPDLPAQMREVVQTRLSELGEERAASDAGATVLRLEISLAPALAGRVPADAVLFVYAKAANGPPMPLAVRKLPGAKLPLEVRLDDGMAMTPPLRLSAFEHYVVTARLSASGSAQPQSGDLEGRIEARRADSGKLLALRIDRVLP
ncbi:MAG: c-type cytochrome biogenesis protein CcmI [Sinobacteraceae bacterium]|nr:c-type cytochrome biogenesis protein CcmI [Nevskia sp.]MDI3259770.1 c-type cytochrome biogenesis protein CcmI [Nevskiaceae bacterium]